MVTPRQNADFANHLFPADPLDTAIEWIKANLSPDDVFDEEQLAEHARNNIEIDAVYAESSILGYVAGTFNPGEVFDTGQLETWAEDNGYVKE
jgi:hypothetical protein